MKEDWTPRRFYRTMRYIFRPDRKNSDSLVEIPFTLNRPLSHAEFRECAEHYVAAIHKEYLAKLVSGQRGGPPQSPDPERWPDVERQGISPTKFWDYEIPLGQLYFAETREQQTQARRRVKNLAQRGPNRARSALSEAARKTPQAKRQFSGHQLLSLIKYRAQCQFIWVFLRHESGLNREELKNPKYAKSASRDLATAYPFLELEPDEILEGLCYSHQADKDTAIKFRLSEATVRSLLSKSVRR